jgi:hypothetical protein
MQRGIKIYMGEDIPHKLLGFPFASIEYSSHKCVFLHGYISINYFFVIFNIIILSIILLGAFHPFIFTQKSYVYPRIIKILQYILLVSVFIITVVNLLLLSFNIFHYYIVKFNVLLLLLWLCLTIFSIYRLCNWLYCVKSRKTNWFRTGYQSVGRYIK